ncbi:MAG: hypothetical protein IJ752_00070 [Alphaproteobacteria bacterium]|nr:hypothetical protein [Alphaproteobacteria bacterium]
MEYLQKLFNKNAATEQRREIPEKLLIDFNISHCFAEMRARAVHIINTIAEYSQTGRKLLRQAHKDGYRLIMTAAAGWAGQVDADHKCICLNACETDSHLIETLAHECRHIQQFSRGVDYGCGAYNIKDAILLHRCKEADAEAFAAAVCHEIRLHSGNEEPWKAFAAGRPFVAAGLEKARRNNAKPTVTPAMLRSAFNGWYEDDKLMRVYEENYIVDGILKECSAPRAEIKDFFHKKTTSAEIVSQVCIDTAGACYWAHEPSVLDERHRLLVNDETLNRAREVLTDIEKRTGIRQNHSYRSLPRRPVKALQ